MDSQEAHDSSAQLAELAHSARDAALASVLAAAEVDRALNRAVESGMTIDAVSVTLGVTREVADLLVTGRAHFRDVTGSSFAPDELRRIKLRERASFEAHHVPNRPPDS